MTKQIQELVLGYPVTFLNKNLNKKLSMTCLPAESSRKYLANSSEKELSKFKQAKSVLQRMNKLGKKADVFATGIREHVRLSGKISETLKAKLRLGARVLQVGGMEKVFRKIFSLTEGEKLLKASQCYLSTTSGPIAGLLFISSHRIAFCSEKSLKLSCPNGEYIRIYYKVSIPLMKIHKANQSENVETPSQKYLQLVTVDNFEFWFMGFLNFQKTFRCLQQVVS